MSRKRVRGILILALANFAAARLTLLFAIPPGYATVIWPPAGIAVAALWIWGLDLWPGVFLASFAANAALASSHGATGRAPLLLAAWIGAASAAQAALATILARRTIGGRDPLAEERDLFRFLMICGPLACLTASLWGTAGLLLFKLITPGNALYDWASWWVGDAIGVVFAAPLILLWSGRKPLAAKRGRLAVTVVMFATTATVIAIHTHAIRTEQTRARAQEEIRLNGVATTLRAGLAEGVEVVRSVADLFESRPGVGRAEFGRFARAALRRHPAVLLLEWRPRVSDSRRKDFEKTEGRALSEVDAAGRLRPRARSTEYFPILYVEPLKGSEKVLGLDINEANPARPALERSLRSGEPSASGGLHLVQEPRSELSVIILVPARTPGSPAADGVAEGIYRVRDAMEHLLVGMNGGVKGLRVADVTIPDSPQALYTSGEISNDPAYVFSLTTDIADRRWRIELSPPEDSQRTEQSWLVLGRALILMYLTCWVVLTLYGRAERIVALVEQKTVELREQERRLMQAQKMESVGRLAGGIAHEFNNILMAASGLAQIVLQALGPGHSSSPDIEGIIAAIKRAGNLVAQLLTYSRRREARIRPTDLKALVERLSKMLGAALGGRVALEFSLGEKPAWVMADAGQAEQVLLNLCFNARDAVGGKGRIRVAVRPETLSRPLETPFVPAAPGSYSVLEISDDGSGIPPEVLPRLLEPFFTTKPFGEGTGLGLSVVSGIIRQHGGGLDIASAPGKGTSVSVYWPAAETPTGENTPIPAEAAPHGSGLILVVDDEPLVCSTLERILAGYGYRTLAASGGQEALNALRDAPEICGVLLDLVMPGMNGLETYDRMIALRPGLKVLVMSGYMPQQSENQVKRRGLPFLGKPSDPAHLAIALHEALTAPPRA